MRRVGTAFAVAWLIASPAVVHLGWHGRSVRRVAGVSHRPVVLPPVAGRFDYQIGGAYAPDANVVIVDRDRSEPPALGKYNVCYLNAFQTQPGESSFWKQHHPGLLLRHRGRLLSDPGWPGEYLLDTSTPAKRTSIAGIEDTWISGCANAGYNAIEPDNLDSWTRSHGLLNEKENLALAGLLATYSHRRGLAIAQKNTDQLGAAGKSTVHFDFAIAEECQVYAECQRYTAVYGRHVIDIEYTDNGVSAFRRSCAARGGVISILLRDRDVTARGDPAYSYQTC